MDIELAKIFQDYLISKTFGLRSVKTNDIVKKIELEDYIYDPSLEIYTLFCTVNDNTLETITVTYKQLLCHYYNKLHQNNEIIKEFNFN